MKAIALVAITMLMAGCAANGTASDVIVRVYHQEFDGCLDADGYTGWSIQLANDHPTEKSRQSYQIRDNMVETAKKYSDSGERVRLTFTGSAVDSDCDRVEKIEPIAVKA